MKKLLCIFHAVWNISVAVIEIHFAIYEVQSDNSNPATSSLTYFWRYCIDLANALFWECLTSPIKKSLSICSNLSCLSTCKKSTEQTCYFRYLGMPGHTHLKWCISLKKPSAFISRQKINFILHVFLEIL